MLNKPSIGRVVWYYPEGHSREAQPLAAQIAYVHSDTMVNLGFYSQVGLSEGATDVQLYQAGEVIPETGRCAQWMPYQAQAQKAQDEKASQVPQTEKKAPF